MIRRLLPSAFCVFLSPLLVAQQAAPLAIQAASPTPVTGIERVHVPIDMPVTFRLEERISSVDTPVGAKVQLSLVNDLSADGHVVAPAGTSCYATVTRSRPKSAHRNGELRFADPELDLGRGQRIRFAPEQSGDRKDDRELVALLLPPAVILAPVWAPWLAIQKIRGAREPSLKLTPKKSWKAYDLEYSEGYRFDYFVRSTVTVRLDKVSLPIRASNSADVIEAH
jgi:hypothetical protein